MFFQELVLRAHRATIPCSEKLPGHFKQHTIAFKELVLGSARKTAIPCSEQFITASHNEVRPMIKLQTQTEKLENLRVHWDRRLVCHVGDDGHWMLARSCPQSLYAV